jgi:hypothetical protein
MLTEAAAPRIVVIDSNGATRAELGVSRDSAHLGLMDSGGYRFDHQFEFLRTILDGLHLARRESSAYGCLSFP